MVKLTHPDLAILPEAYPMVWEEDALGRIIVTAPDWPEFCVVSFASLASALAEARVRLALAIRDRRNKGLLIPYASRLTGLGDHAVLIAVEEAPAGLAREAEEG